MTLLKHYDVPMPIWDDFTPESDNYTVQKRDAFDYIRLNMTSKDLKTESILYLSQHNFNPRHLKQTSDHIFATVGKYCWMLNNGAVFDEDTQMFFATRLDELSIQLDKTPPTISEASSVEDEGFNLFDHFEDFIIYRTLDVDCTIAYQLLDDTNPTTKALISLINHLKDHVNFMKSFTNEEPNFDRDVAFPTYDRTLLQYTKLLQMSKIYKQNHQQKKKNDRDRIAPGGVAKRSTKATENVNYKKEDIDLKLVSIDPVSIIGKSGLLSYNVKTRKISLFCATSEGFEMRGTTVHNIDEDKSFQKTIRDPLRQLRGFHDAQPARVKILMGDDYIKSKKQPVSGRINTDTILMMVW